MVTESELIEVLDHFIPRKDTDDSLSGHLAFIGMQLERIAKVLEKGKI